MKNIFLIPSQYSAKNIKHLLAFGFGSGLFRKAPGTFGTIAGLLFYIVFLSHHFYILLAAILMGFVVGVYLCGSTANDLGVHDFGGIVWDEFIGLWISIAFFPLMNVDLLDGLYLFLAFILFRIFDILKPWPIIILDKKVHGGFGIMIDDVLAGVYAGLALMLVDSFILTGNGFF